MKFTSAFLSVVLACGLVAAAPSKIITLFSDVDYQGSKYTIKDNRLTSCVDFTQGPLVVRSAQVFHGTTCEFYTQLGCGVGSAAFTIATDTPDTGLIELKSIQCI